MTFQLIFGTIAKISFLLLPITIAFSILRYRLYDIDIIIRRTFIYGTLTSLGFGVYFLIVGGASTILQSQNNLFPALIAIGLVAVLFRPLLQRLQQATDRIMPYTPPPEALAEKQQKQAQTEKSRQKAAVSTDEAIQLRGNWLVARTNLLAGCSRAGFLPLGR